MATNLAWSNEMSLNDASSFLGLKGTSTSSVCSLVIVLFIIIILAQLEVNLEANLEDANP